MFLLDDRKPVYARTKTGIEFKCSYKLSNKSLENVGKDLQKYIVRKMVDDLDYEIMRTPLTPLTPEELKYCENDIRVLLSYIQEKIEQDGDITKIPLTNTGYVRNFCRKRCYARWKRYRQIMNNLIIDPAEYSQLKRAFQGGFTHANAHYVKQVLENVGSHDLTSSYPAVMVLEKFPMSQSRLIDYPITSEDELVELLSRYCCIFDITIHGLVPKLHQDHPISRHKCWRFENGIVDNGRVVIAELLSTTITEQDFFVYKEFYDWEYIEVANIRAYEKQYLPKALVKSILELYMQKTTLKDVEGEEVNYMIYKAMLNACFGMTVTDPLREENTYVNDTYFTVPVNLNDGINKYNSNIRRFLYYPWGVWVTAYARANLFSAIIAMGDDYVYADTDSVKVLNPEKHTEYFERYNQQIERKIKKSSEYFRIEEEYYVPENKKHDKKIIGVWDDEGVYSQFKTLGAKRYMYRKGEHHTITLAGANKKRTMEWLQSTGKPFELFDDELTISKDASGRLILTYIDDETEGDVTDVNGVPYHYHELSSIHMEASEYNLSMSEEYIRYLKQYREIED